VFYVVLVKLVDITMYL